MLNLKLQYVGHLIPRADSLEKTLMLGKTEDRRKGTAEDEMHHWLYGLEFEQAPGDGEGQGSLECCSPRGHRVRLWLNDWTATTTRFFWPDRLKLSSKNTYINLILAGKLKLSPTIGRSVDLCNLSDILCTKVNLYKYLEDNLPNKT